MKFSGRRLLSRVNSSGETEFITTSSSNTQVSISSKEESTINSVGLTVGNSKNKNSSINKSPRKVIETADSVETADLSITGTGLGGGIQVSSVQIENMFTDLLDPYMVDTLDVSQPPVLLYRVLRDIYYYDAYAGGAVDMFTNLPFSDFTLTGIKDSKGLDPFYSSISNMRIRRFLPNLSTEYLTYGMMAGKMVFDKDKKVFTDIIPHNPMFIRLEPTMEFGRDPKVFVERAAAETAMRMKMGRQATSNKRQGTSEQIDPDSLLYMTRKGLISDMRGLSYFKRILPLWFFEKALIRGTLDQSYKRQRSIAHIKLGTPEWTPSNEDMSVIANLFAEADLDPLGAIFVTREGVDVSEIRRGDDFWKFTDVSDQIGMLKMKALGINEAILSGDATLNTIEMSMSVFIESVREHRDAITQELFYDRMFPKIAEANGITRSRYVEEAGLRQVVTNKTDNSRTFVETAFSHEAGEKYVMPSIHWHKQLKPESDSNYMEILKVLEEKGIPLPLRMYGAAAGINLDSVLEGMEEDKVLRDKFKKFRKEVGIKLESDTDDSSDNEFENASGIRHVGLGNRLFEGANSDEELIMQPNSKGKMRPVSLKRRKEIIEDSHKKIVEASKNLSARK